MSEEPASYDVQVGAQLQAKAALLLLLFALLVGATIGYLLYARGVFEAKQTLVLVADDSEGVRIGMDMTFAGFPIGRVRAIKLAQDGSARILVDVPKKEAHWLRSSSVFTLVRSLVGGAGLRAYSGAPTDPELPDGAERRVLIGDAGAELPRLVASARELMQNLAALSAPGSPLAESLAQLQALATRLNGPRGAAPLLLGGDAQAEKLALALSQTNRLLERFDGIAARADSQLLGPGGLVPEGRAGLAQLTAMLGEARGTLRRVDALLAEAQVVAGNAREASTDLGALRGEVDATVRKLEQLVNEVNRKWPFARDTEIKLR